MPPPGDYDRELRLELSAITRVGAMFQVGVLVPLLRTFRQAGSERSAAGGLGDVAAFGRWDIVPVGGRGDVPGIAFTLALLTPTGRPVRSSHDRLLSDATGLGVFEVRPGIVLEKAWWTGWFVTVGTSIGFRTPFHDGDVSVALSPRWQVIAAGGPTWTSGFGLALGALHEREAGPKLDGVRAPATGRARTAMLGVATYDVDDRWSLFLSAQIDLPVASLGQNDNVGVALAIGLRAVWGVYE